MPSTYFPPPKPRSFLDELNAIEEPKSFADQLAAIPTQGAVTDAAKRTGRGLVDQPGGLTQSLGTIMDWPRRASDAVRDYILPTTTPEQVEAREALKASERAKFGDPARVVEDTGRQMRKDARELYTGEMAPDSARDDTLLAKVADNVGPLAASLATPGGVLAKTFTGMALNSQGAADEAEQILIQQGVPAEKARDEAARQFVLNLPAGALESVAWGKLLGRYGQTMAEAVAKKFGETAWKRILKTAIEQGAVEGGEEWLQQVGQNAAAKATYDPERELTKGADEAALLGSVMGGGLATTLQVGAEVADRLDDTGKNKPERPQDLKAQRAQLLKGDRAVQMFPTGTEPLPVPDGMQSIRNERGVFHFNPQKIGAAQILELSEQGRENELLGLGPVSKAEVLKRAAKGEPVATVTERGPAGEELRGAMVTPTTVKATISAMEKGKSADSTVKLEALAETLKKRDVLADIEASLPDGESRDHVRGRTKQDLQRMAQGETDMPALWKTTVDAVLATGASAKEFAGLERSLELLGDKEARKEAGLKAKVTPESITAMLGNTVLDGALRGSEFARLRDALAKSPANIEALLAEFKRAREGAVTAAPASVNSPKPSGTGLNTEPSPAPAVREPLPPPPPMNPRAGILPERGDQVDREMRRQKLREQIAAEAEQEKIRRAEIDRKKAGAEQALKEAAVKRQAESARLATIDKTGRDPESGRISDLRKLPSRELENFDWDKDRYLHDGGEVMPEDIDAVLSKRFAAEERAPANGGDAGYTLLDLLKGKREALQAAGLSKPLRLLSPKEARARGTLAGEHETLRERTRGFAYFANDGLAEDTLQEKLAELGFAATDTSSAYELIERAMNGEEVRPNRARDDVQFTRRPAQFAKRARVDETPFPQRAAQWWQNLQRVAPGLAKEAELRFGSSEDLVEKGLARRDDITGEKEAARWRDAAAKKEIFYLFEKALRANTADVTRLNLQHEMGHAFWDTLDRNTQERLQALFDQEIETNTGPLFADGELRDNVALGATEDIQEWFAERMAHANDRWAQRRIETTARGDTIMATIAAQFRRLLLQMRELMEKHLVLNGYDDALLRDFRKFLDQGTKWTAQTEQAEASFARRERSLEITPELAAKNVQVVALPEKPLPGKTPGEVRKAAWEAAAEWINTTVRNADTGDSIRLTAKAIEHGFSRPGAANVYIIPALPELMRTAVHLAVEMPRKGGPEVKLYHRYAAALKLGTQLHRVKLTVREMVDGTKLYDHEATEIETPAGILIPSRIPEGKLDAGPSAGATLTIGQLFGGVKPGAQVQFARRTGAKTEAEFDQALRDFDRFERQRDELTSKGQKVPREVLTALSDAREVLDNSWPTWRQSQKERAAELAQNAADNPEPEAGVSADLGTDPIDPQATAGKRSRLEASSFRPPGNVGDWVAGLAKLFGNFRSAIPELPGGAAGRVFTRFRQGFRMMKAATETVRHEAEERIAHVLEPITALGGEAIAPNEYRRLINVQAAIKALTDDGKAVPPKLHAELAELEAKLDTLPYHLFRKTVLYRDLWFRSKILNDSGEPITLPMNLTREEVQGALEELHAKIEAAPGRAAIEESLRRHYELVKTTREDLLARGYIIPEELRNPLYFPHLVLEKFSGRLQTVKLDTAEDFRSYLQQLVGSAKDIETDYLTAMYYHMGQLMAHNARQDIVETYWQPYDQTAELKEELKAINAQRAQESLGPLKIEQIIPKGSEVYIVDKQIPLRPGYLIDRAKLSKRLGLELGEGDLQAQLREVGMEVTITAEDITESLIAGEKITWIVPRPVAEALRAIVKRDTKEMEGLDKIAAKTLGIWKQYILHAPWNAFRYNYGNFITDLEKLFMVDPDVFSQLRPALREVQDFFAGGDPSPELREAFRRGVIDGITAAEVGDLKSGELAQFEKYLTSQERLMGMLNRRLGWSKGFSRVREATFRFAKFKADLERMRRGETPVYAGAYHKDIEAIEDSKPGAGDAIYAKAAEIARKTFGDYDDISVSGDAMRRKLIPFYSWMEVNFKYHANLLRNVLDMKAGAGASLLARGTAVGASKVLVPRSATGVLLRLALPYVAVALWNNSDDREDLEKALSEEDRRRFHIIWGKDKKGVTQITYLPTALSDVMKWFGGNRFTQLATEYMRGDIKFDRLVHEWASNLPKDVINNLVGSVRPEVQTAFVALAGKKLFPDLFDMRNIPPQDYWWRVLDSMVDPVAGDMIRRMVDGDYYPNRTKWEVMQQAVLQVRRRDPEQSGYWATMDRVDAWKAAHGGNMEITREFAGEAEDESMAEARILASFSRAIRNADVPAAAQYYRRLLSGDGGKFGSYTKERFAAKVRFAEPLQRIAREQRQAFVEQMAPAERRDLDNAYRYYQKMEAFKGKEHRLFPSKKASPAFKQRFAENPRADVFAGLMLETDARPEADEELKAEKLLETALRKR